MPARGPALPDLRCRRRRSPGCSALELLLEPVLPDGGRSGQGVGDPTSDGGLRTVSPLSGSTADVTWRAQTPARRSAISSTTPHRTPAPGANTAPQSAGPADARCGARARGRPRTARRAGLGELPHRTGRGPPGRGNLALDVHPARLRVRRTTPDPTPTLLPARTARSHVQLSAGPRPIRGGSHRVPTDAAAVRTDGAGLLVGRYPAPPPSLPSS